jgi:hypothetical protein
MSLTFRKSFFFLLSLSALFFDASILAPLQWHAHQKIKLLAVVLYFGNSG